MRHGSTLSLKEIINFTQRDEPSRPCRPYSLEYARGMSEKKNLFRQKFPPPNIRYVINFLGHYDDYWWWWWWWTPTSQPNKS